MMKAIKTNNKKDKKPLIDILFKYLEAIKDIFI